MRFRPDVAHGFPDVSTGLISPFVTIEKGYGEGIPDVNDL